MNSNYQKLIKAIIAGILVGIGGILYASASNKVIGAVLFSFALLLIVSRGYNLFTGKVGYLLPYKKGNLKDLGITVFGNVIGVFSISSLFLLSGKSETITNANQLFLSKLDQEWYEVLVLAIFCGFMMYIAVDTYSKIKNQLTAVLIVVFAVVIFIVVGFEHSVADLVYLVLGTVFTFKALLFIIIVMIGNLIGAVFLNLLHEQIKDS